MAIQYPGGTYVNTTFTGGTKTQIVNAMETQLNNAGWTTISGAGTGDIVLESATTPTAANLIRVRLRDAAATNCAVVNMQNAAAAKVSQNYFLLPAASKTFKIVANKYMFACYEPGSTTARGFVLCGTLWLPTWLHTVITAELGFINGNAINDTDVTVRTSFRTRLSCGVGAETNALRHSGLCNNNLADITTDGTGNLRLLIKHSASFSANQGVPTSGYRWHDDTLIADDPLIAWGLTSYLDESKVRGMLWGAALVAESLVGDTIYTAPFADGHNFIAITNSSEGTAGTNARGTLLMAVT